jgi:hypothetical protein
MVWGQRNVVPIKVHALSSVFDIFLIFVVIVEKILFYKIYF